MVNILYWLFIAFGRDILLILQIHKISLHKNNSQDLHNDHSLPYSWYNMIISFMWSSISRFQVEQCIYLYYIKLIPICISGNDCYVCKN